MSYIHGKAERRLKRTRYSTRPLPLGSVGGEMGGMMNGANRKLYPQPIASTGHVTIGNIGTTGVTFLASQTNPQNTATNPNGRLIPMGTSGDPSRQDKSNDTLAFPDYPLQLSGRGVMSFPQPVKLNSILGGLSVKGTVTCDEINTPNKQETFTPVLKDALGNTVTQTTSLGTITHHHGYGHILISVEWNASTLDPAENIVLEGLPSLPAQCFHVQNIKGFDADTTGNNIIGKIDVGPSNVIEFFEIEGPDPLEVKGSQVDSVGQIIISQNVLYTS